MTPGSANFPWYVDKYHPKSSFKIKTKKKEKVNNPHISGNLCLLGYDTLELNKLRDTAFFH